MQRVKLYGCLNGPRAVKDADTGEPVGGVLARIDIVIEPNQPTRAILADINGNELTVEVVEIDLQ